MTFDVEKWKRETAQHVEDPQPGDYFADHCCPVAWIVSRDGDKLMLRKGKIEGTDRWGEPELMYVGGFVKWLAYGSIPGYWAEWAGNRMESES